MDGRGEEGFGVCAWGERLVSGGIQLIQSGRWKEQFDYKAKSEEVDRGIKMQMCKAGRGNRIEMERERKG